MIHTLTKQKDASYELVVEIDKDELADFVHETEKQLANQVRIEGFRQGKVPPDVMRSKLGEDTIRQEALQTAVQQTLIEVLTKEKLDLITQKDFKIKENTPEKLIYSVQLVTFPDVELGQYTGLEIKKNEPSVTPDEISKVIQDVAKSRATMHDVSRAAQTGDRVEVDFTITDKGDVIDGGKSENHPIVIGERRFVPGFEDQIVGMNAGETKSFSLEMPKDYFQKTIAGKKLDFEVKLQKVQERTVPELDDAFAQSLGRFTTVQELQQNVEQGLLLEKENKEKERLRLKIIETIAEKTTCAIPELLIEERLDAMVEGFDQELHGMGMELALYLAQAKKTQEDLRKEWRKQAESQVKSSLILREVAKKENINVSPEELDEEVQMSLQQYAVRGGQKMEDMLKNINIEDVKKRVYSFLLNEKVFSFLESKTTFVTA